MFARLLRVGALAALALGGCNLQAQEAPAPAQPRYPKFEASVLAGYRFEGSLTFQDDIGPYRQVDFDNAPTFGLTLGYNYSPFLEVEFQYSYANPSVTSFARVPGNPNRAFDVGVHDIQLVPMINSGTPTDRVRVFLGLGIGVTILNSSEGVVDTVLPSFSVPLGMKLYLSEH